MASRNLPSVSSSTSVSASSTDLPALSQVAIKVEAYARISLIRTGNEEESPLSAARKYLLEKRGHQFDPACVDAFLSRWD